MQPEDSEVISRPSVYSPNAEANGLEPDAKVREETSGSVPGRARQIHINVTIARHGPGKQGREGTKVKLSTLEQRVNYIDCSSCNNIKN